MGGGVLKAQELSCMHLVSTITSDHILFKKIASIFFYKPTVPELGGGVKRSIDRVTLLEIFFFKLL